MTRTTYDDHHHVLTQTDALGHTTRFVNDSCGLPLTITHPDGEEVNYTYNRFERPTSLRSAGGITHTREYDAHGNCTVVTSPTGATTRYGYDARARSRTSPMPSVRRPSCGATRPDCPQK
ncbi:hypothetical protein NKH77_23455 [Streptomyces sp. M19]